MYNYTVISPIGTVQVFKNFPALHDHLASKAYLLHVHCSTVEEIIQYMNRWSAFYTRPDGVKINLNFRAVPVDDEFTDISFLYDFDTSAHADEASRELEIYVI